MGDAPVRGRVSLKFGLEGVAQAARVGDSHRPDADHLSPSFLKNGSSNGFFLRNIALSDSHSALPRATSLAIPCIHARTISNVGTLPTSRLSTSTVASGCLSRF